MSVGSISFLILISASRTIGPHWFRSISYVWSRGFWPGTSGSWGATSDFREQLLLSPIIDAYPAIDGKLLHPGRLSSSHWLGLGSSRGRRGRSLKGARRRRRQGRLWTQRAGKKSESTSTNKTRNLKRIVRPVEGRPGDESPAACLGSSRRRL